MNDFFRGWKVILIVLLFNLTQVAGASSIDAKPDGQQTVKIAVKNVPFSLSPYALMELDSQYSHLFFDPLIRWGSNKKIEYRLLEKLKIVNNNIRFSLKKNITFHSGNILTSDDVIWSYEEALKNKRLQQTFTGILKIKRINNYQFDIQTELTQRELLDYLTHLYILDSAYYKKNKIIHNKAQIALLSPIQNLPLSGTGPYRVHSFYAGVNLRVQSNLTYWGNQPFYQSINFIKIKSIDSRLYALLADDVDIAQAIASKNLKSVYLLDNKRSYQTAPLNALFLMINETGNYFLEKEEIRDAIHLAINQPGMLKHILKGAGSIDRSINSRLLGTKSSDTQAHIYDDQRATYLLKKIGIPETLSLLMMDHESDYMKEVVSALKNMLKKVGIEVNVTRVNTIQKWNELQFEHDLLLANWSSPLVESTNIYRDIFFNSRLSQYIDFLFKKQNKALTVEEKVVLFDQYQSLDYIVPLLFQNEIWAMDKQFNLQNIFSVNGIPYWHLLTPTP